MEPSKINNEPERQDSLMSIPRQLIEKLVDKAKNNPQKYNLEYVAQVINRSMAGEYISNRLPGIRKGHLYDPKLNPDGIRSNQSAITTDDQGNNFPLSIDIRRGEMLVQIEGMTFPGVRHGKEIFSALDNKLSSIGSNAQREDKNKLAALTAIVISAAHAFPDASGRTAVGAADFFLKLNNENGIDYSALVKRNMELIQALAFSTFCMLPSKYNSEIIFGQMNKSSEKHRVIQIPTLGRSTAEELFEFEDKFSESIITFIENFELNRPPKNNLEIQVNNLARLFEECADK
jgi:prophage maintenance system killer protein